MCRKNERTGGILANWCKLNFRIVFYVLQDSALLVKIDHIKSRETPASGDPSEWIQPKSIVRDLGDIFNNRCEGLLNGID